MRNFLTKIKQLLTANSRDARTRGDSYLKYLSGFVSLATEERRIGKYIDGIEEYDFDADRDEQLFGHLSKSYARLHKGYFKNIENDLRNSFSNSYSMYFSTENAQKKGVPENISILLKRLQSMGFISEEHDNRKMYNERVTPRILDFFGAKTTYNEILTVDVLNRYILSVYFIKPKQSFYSAKLLNVKDGEELPVAPYFRVQDELKEVDLQLDNLVKKIYEKYHKKPKINREQIKAEFIYSYLVREVLVGDRDFNERNFGYIYDEKTNEITFAPNFDFELAFFKDARQSKYLGENLEYIKTHHKVVYDEFFERLNAFASIEEESGDPLYKMILKQDIVEQSQLDYFYKVLRNNSDFLLDYSNGKFKVHTNAEQSR